MRITESKLRRLIRHVINESIEVGEISKLLKSDFDFESFNAEVVKEYKRQGPPDPLAENNKRSVTVDFIKKYFHDLDVNKRDFKKIMIILAKKTRDKKEYKVTSKCVLHFLSDAVFGNFEYFD